MVMGPKTQMVLQQYSLVSDNMGGYTDSWQAKRKMKGILISLTGNERYVTGKTEVFRTHRFIVDFPLGISITEKDKYVFGIRTFDIQVVANPAEQNRQLEIDLLEIT